MLKIHRVFSRFFDLQWLKLLWREFEQLGLGVLNHPLDDLVSTLSRSWNSPCRSYQKITAGKTATKGFYQSCQGAAVTLPATNLRRLLWNHCFVRCELLVLGGERGWNAIFFHVVWVFKTILLPVYFLGLTSHVENQDFLVGFDTAHVLCKDGYPRHPPCHTWFVPWFQMHKIM